MNYQLKKLTTAFVMAVSVLGLGSANVQATPPQSVNKVRQRNYDKQYEFHLLEFCL